MDNPSKKHSNHQPKKFWHWIITFAVILSLFSGSFLLYRWWKIQQTNPELQTKEKELAQLEQQEQAKAIEQYQIQKDWVNLTAPLAQNPQVKQVFHHLLQIYADRYAQQQKLVNSHLPLLFGGFYQKAFSPGEKQGEMGNCVYVEQNKLVIIKLNQLYLLNKLGYENYFATPECYLVIDFATLTETLAHELAHYIQFVKYGQSSCESSGKKAASDKFLFPKLVAEHTKITSEIKETILNSTEYEKFAEWWKEIN